MTKKELKKFTEIIEAKRKKNTEYLKMQNECEELAKSPKVAKYIELRKKLTAKAGIDALHYNESKEIQDALKKLDIIPMTSNHIYVYIGSYKKENHPNGWEETRKTEFDDPSTQYHLVSNLENWDDSKKVLVKDFDKFCEKNSVLKEIPKNSGYNDIQKLFGEYVIKYGQEEAVDLIKRQFS